MTNADFCHELKLRSDRICNSIFHEDLEWVDIAIQINDLRYFCEEHAPDQVELFDMIYASRFTRLWDTWGRHTEPKEWEEIGSAREENYTNW